MIDDSRIVGCILGTAVGDALGLPYEGVSRQRLPRLLGPPDRHRFLFGYGMISDDTEHTCLVAQSIIASGSDVDAFTRQMGRRLRWWLASLPAGLGRATLHSCVKLWFGVPPDRSGVFSAGNGPAMRSALIGACIEDIDTMVEYVRVSARVTHSDPKAEYGAIAVALATHMGCRDENVVGSSYLERLEALIGSDGAELIALLRTVIASVSECESTLDFAMANGFERGVSGYTYHTVPIAIHAWLSNPHDFRESVSSVIQCGGDADTTAAIVGSIVGAATGESGIPENWLSCIVEWPRSVNWMRNLSEQLAQSRNDLVPTKPIQANFVATLVRNLGFLVVVLFHGFRRLFPPY
ncbi:MAG: ADP-ribosylglycohydrolase family protein [Planctomycetota bacterium]